MISGLDFLWVGLAALAAGIINAVAGGGTLITFPMMTAVGIPPVVANVTNSVALCPGYLGGTIAQWRDLQRQSLRLRWLVPIAMLGGIGGGLLLLNTGERVFSALVPYLILLASLLLAIQDPLKHWLARRIEKHAARRLDERWAALPIGLSAIYGGYFGAGLGIIMLATLGITIDDTLTRLNALKQLLSLVINFAAAVYFAWAAPVWWPVAAVMAIGALLGGALGGRLAGTLKPQVLRYAVVAVGTGVGIYYLFR
jgi:uncharacterized protein